MPPVIQLHQRRVKIVATLGPSSQEESQLYALIQAGLDVARLNFSHGDHKFHEQLIANVRAASKKARRPIGLLQDLQGPKLRAGKLPKEGIDLKAGDVLLLYPEGSEPKLSQKGRRPIPISAEIAEPISRDCQPGSKILFDDGKISTRVKEVSSPELVVEVEVGGRLTSNKGMNLPGTPLTMPCLTPKDIKDLKFGLSQGVDAIALSFVRTPQDIEDLRALVRKNSNYEPLLVSKIEREEAIEDMDAIIEVSDGLLVARGDMAVELGAERVPSVQKRMIRSCNELGVPIITATQMLESMISCPTPTRAEASDVANAVFDGTDAVMLSAETASGQYPVETIQVMSRIIHEAENNPEFLRRPADILPMPGSSVESIEFSASRIAHHVGAVVIACLTHSGTAARALAKFRPDVPIVAIVDREEVLRRLSLTWGVRGVVIPKIVATDDIFQVVEKILIKEQLASQTDMIVVTAGLPTLRRGTTNMVKVHKVGTTSERSPQVSKGAAK